MAFTIEKTLNAGSGDTSAAGSISTIQTNTPTAHVTLMSAEDLRRPILTMSGMFHKGSATPATSPTVVMNPSSIVSRALYTSSKVAPGGASSVE